MVSIVTVTKNNRDGLLRTLESVRMQTMQPGELFVVDGHSNDGTSEVLAKYAGTVTGVILDEGRGIFSAMNQGIEAVSGKWILFLNAGDVFASPESLKQIAPHLSEDMDFVFGKSLCPDGSEKHPYTQWRDPWALMPFSHQAIFNHRRVFKRRKYNTKYRIAADRDYYLWAYRRGMRFKPTEVAVCICETEGVSNQDIPKRLREVYRVGLRHYPFSIRMHWYFLLHLGRLKWLLHARQSLGGRFGKHD